MSEHIVREAGYPGTLKQEIVGELVRCRECKYSGHLWGNIFCKHFADEMSVQITEDDYCSRGGRKDDESV